MSAQTIPRQRQIAALRSFLLGGLLVLLFLLSGASLLLDTRPAPPASSAPAGAVEEVIYVAYGRRVDTVYAALASDPTRRRKLFDAPHAENYGVVASLAPDGRRIAFNALAPATPAPSPDSPADLWLSPLEGARPVLGARDVDLRVRPVWSPASDAIVFRRSIAAADVAPGFRLYLLDAASAREREVAFSADAALFPVGFGAGGRLLYYTRLTERGSELRAVDLKTGDDRGLALLFEGLTRDWTLSPGGDMLAFLAMTLTADDIASRAMVIDLRTGEVTRAGSATTDEFSPAWRGEDLTVGRLGAGASGRVESAFGSATALTPPDRGFDVPLAWSPSGGLLAVRTFEGSSAAAPGRSVIALVDADGGRRLLASGEVTLLGWTTR